MDRYITLILIYLTFNLPIVIWIVTDQFRGIPYDLDEAARMEGASQFMTMLGAPIGQVRRGSARGAPERHSDAHTTLLRGHGEIGRAHV